MENNFNGKRNKRERGFTIVELIIVLVVVAVLISVLLPCFSSSIDNAKKSVVMQECKTEWNNYVQQTMLKNHSFKNTTHIICYADGEESFSAYFLALDGQFQTNAYSEETSLNEKLDENNNGDKFNNYTKVLTNDYEYANTNVKIFNKTTGAEADAQSEEKGTSDDNKEGGESEPQSGESGGNEGGESQGGETPSGGETGGESGGETGGESGGAEEKKEETSEKVLSFNLTGGGYEITGFISGESTTEIVIPSSYNGVAVVSIGEKAFFECDDIISVKLPDTIVSIGDYAFYKCFSLTTINLPENLISIENFAFYYCTSLESITLPDNLTSIGIYAFGCSSIESVIIPDSILTIGSGAFSSCSSLTSLILGKNVVSIGELAFASSGLSGSLIIPENIKTIGFNAFNKCAYERIEFEYQSGWFRTKNINSKGTSVSVNNAETNAINMTTIRDYMYYRN